MQRGDSLRFGRGLFRHRNGTKREFSRSRLPHGDALRYGEVPCDAGRRKKFSRRIRTGCHGRNYGSDREADRLRGQFHRRDDDIQGKTLSLRSQPRGICSELLSRKRSLTRFLPRKHEGTSHQKGRRRSVSLRRNAQEKNAGSDSKKTQSLLLLQLENGESGT